MRHRLSSGHRFQLVAIVVSLIVFSLRSVFAADWPCWRGPDGLGVSAEKNLPVQWSKDKNIAWKTAIPGKGISSPIVVGDRVYLTTQTPDTGLHVLALERKSGALVWDREIGQGKLRSHNLHNMATPTSASDGKHVCALFGTGDLACLDAAGKIVWQRNLVKEFGEYKTNHGYGTSPMLHDGKVFVACMHQGPSYLIAMDALTGKTAWKNDRNLEAKEEAQDSYSSPLFIRKGRTVQLVLAGAESLTAYDPADGALLWKTPGLNVQHPYGRTISGPAAGDDTVIAVASGFQNRGYLVGVKPVFRSPGSQGPAEVARSWTQAKFAPDCPTPVVYRDHVYLIRDDGMGSCLDVKTGEAHWQERLFSANIKVSPVAGDGKVYVMSGQGACAVLKAGSKLEILSTNDLGEATLCTPALSHGQLFIRTESNLFCIGQ